MENNENLSLVWEVRPNVEIGSCVRIYNDRISNALVVREESEQGVVIGKVMRYEPESIKKQLDEQLRINGMGQERELKLMTELGTLKSQLAKAEEVIEFYGNPNNYRAGIVGNFNHYEDIGSSFTHDSGVTARTYLAQRKAEK